MGFALLFHKQNKDVGQKLIGATGLMFTLPLLVFFVVRYVAMTQYQMVEPDTYAGGAAILMTNIIIAAYCYMAFHEEDVAVDGRGNPIPPPRVGQFKERTD